MRRRRWRCSRSAPCCGAPASTRTRARRCAHFLPVALIKLFVHPVLVFALGVGARALGAPLSAFALTVLTLAAALPSASNVSLLAERYGADNGRIARIIMASTVLAFVTFSASAWLFGVGETPERQSSVALWYSVYRVKNRAAMTAQLVKLQPAPDLVERVYRALLDAISDGSLAPGRPSDAGRHRRAPGGVAPTRAAGAAPAEEGRPRARRARARRRSSPRSTPPASPRSTKCAARSTRSPHAWPPSGARDRSGAASPSGRRAARGKDIRAMVDADIAFHNAIYDASGNPLIAQSAQLHWVQLRRVMGAVLRQSRQREAIWDEHEAIAAAIAGGDAERPPTSSTTTGGTPARTCSPAHRLVRRHSTRPERTRHETHPRTDARLRPRRLSLLPRPVQRARR